MNDQMTNIIELIDENGEVLSFEHIMTLDYNETEYIVLAPLNQESGADEDEIVILRVEQDENGDDCYAGIEDEEELAEVFSAVSEVYEQGLN
ncbi:MAG: DUF1292 domain-containing protein [Caldicoprobacterales bacterium]|jgi:uncharacterized protein YrzB (UPF0473 family)|nr:DUF1292 domain-containing protein [Clostridiales bacterium]